MSFFASLGPYVAERSRTAPPFMQLTVSALFSCRFLGGVLFGYGGSGATLFSAVFAALFAARAISLANPSKIPAARAFGAVSQPESVLPFALMSGLALADFAAAPGDALFAWPGILIAAAFFNPLAMPFASSAACAFFCGLWALCCVGGGADPERLFTLIASVGIGIGVFLSSRAETVRAFAEAERRTDRERSLSALRDAEVEIAARIQRSLLLDAPPAVLDGLRVEPITVASAAVDGDLYGLSSYAPDSVDVLIGDVMGKGVPAALLGAALKNAFLRSSLRLLVERPGALPAVEDLVAAVHGVVADDLSALESFASAQYARIDARQLCMDFVDCGHPSIIHYDASLNLTWALKGSDLPFGFTDDASYSRYSVPLSEGDRLVFYSDGITEAPDGSGELFGEDRLASIVGANAASSPAELVRRILNTALYFTSSAGFRDDVTCIALAVDRSPGRVARAHAAFPSRVEELGAVRAFVAASFAGEDEEALSRVLLAVAEAASNIIRHGIGGSSGEAAADPPEAGVEGLGSSGGESAGSHAARPYEEEGLRVECVRSSERLFVRFVYAGSPFAWHLPPVEPDIETFPEGGFGRSLMASAADSVLYASSFGGLQLACLHFRRGL